MPFHTLNINFYSHCYSNWKPLFSCDHKRRSKISYQWPFFTKFNI